LSLPESLPESVPGAREPATDVARPSLGATQQAALVAIAERVMVPNYRPAPVVLERGDGVWVQDLAGERYLDLVSGIAVSLLGHAHPELVAALQDQAAKLLHTSNLYLNGPSVQLAERLVAHSFAERVFFCNSGAEANEAAIKLARRAAFLRGETERVEIVSFEHGFHGRTFGALAATAQPKYHEGFQPLPAGFRYLAVGDLDALHAAVGPKTAAIIIEPVQGEGGVRPVPPSFLQALRRAADAAGALLVFDEVQCGMGRSGKLFCYETTGVVPDVLTLAKGIGAGLPLGALLTTTVLASALGVGAHGTTYGGNPMATRAGLVALDVVTRPGFLDQVARVGAYLRAGLEALGRRHGVFAEVRGKGLLVGAELAPSVPYDAKAVVDAARAEHLLVHVAGTRVMRLAPPLILTEADVDVALAALDRAFARLGSPTRRP
jgi:predicted acetylornithine/succinylornithine family transaminase